MAGDEGYRLLIVDDQENYRATLILVLRKDFKAIDQAENLEKALALLQKNHYDAVITDGVFPKQGHYAVDGEAEENLNGILVARAAKNKGIFVVGISSNPKLLGNVPDVTFKKPFDLLEVRQAIRNHFEKK